jgi:protein-L-isoaspartate(D-aspartate) O-methyltransferase
LPLLALAAGPLWARDPYELVRYRMVENYVVAEGVKNPRVLDAMRRTPRHEFVPAELRPKVYYDMALPIGNAQTISPPYIVAFMTEQLDPRPTDKVLEIGTGSGYQAAVLSPLVKEVYTIEIVEPLALRAAATLRRLRYDNVHAKVGDGFKGWPDQAPFDKIIVTCSPEDVPKPLVEQLVEGGRMVIPLGERYQQTLYLFRKKDGQLTRESLAPTMFVPMTGQAEADRKIKPDPTNPRLVNFSFEELDEKTGRPTSWYYQRQLTIETAADAPDGNRYATLVNREPGRLAQTVQAFPVDGRRVKVLTFSCWAKGSAITPLAVAGVCFYDQDRKTVAEVTMGRWRGSFSWQESKTRIPVPPAAREALIRIDMQGSTGAISFDRVMIEAGP